MDPCIKSSDLLYLLLIVVGQLIRYTNHYSPFLKFYNNVDCSDITYDTPPSPTILEAVEKAKQRLNATEGDLMMLESKKEMHI